MRTSYVHLISEEEFKWAHKVYRCTHGVFQKSRANGQRNRGVRYTGCRARFTPHVVQMTGGTFKIILRNECHTHNHETTKRLASVYMTFPSTTEDGRRLLFLQMLKCLSVQQTRNLIRDNIGNESGEERCKTILHELFQLDDCDVLVMQHELDITYEIILKTGLQKNMFQQWDETIAMDFTHGINNLGYHLGRKPRRDYGDWERFPVFDFLCLNQLPTTIDTILNAFKVMNTTWVSIASVVIDKDFVEWRSIEKAFPDTQVLLCQFHLISYWKKLMKRTQFRLTEGRSEQLLKHLTNLTYRYYLTECGYEISRKSLETYCKRIKRTPIFDYFMKNWHSC
ncbi:hypothetical protein PHMEG_0003918 [Phytophthora megakarya]|uniref:ZSWIM1/3 RNaseH-like domain-containing protein n=1 Tax=Phytophthora megakarya TaxID=4795 RepID=A0A225WV08_9STRA|nr:hypothetical protein PHMEG_0003918 [Phytophthora megakarya]